jgi:hypothetical protein
VPKGWECKKSNKGDHQIFKPPGAWEWGTVAPPDAKLEGLIAVANTIKDMGALSKLSLKNNRLATAEAGEALGEALKGSTVLKELDVSSNCWVAPSYLAQPDGLGFAQGISQGIVGNGALTTLILKGNKLLTPEAGKVLAGMLAANTVLKELDVSSNVWQEQGWSISDGPGFAKELAVGISENGAMTSLNLANNELCGPSNAREMSGNNKYVFISSSICVLCNLCSFDLFRRDRSCQRPP